MVSGDVLQDVFTENLKKEILACVINNVIKRRRIYFSLSIQCIFVKFDLDGDIEQKIDFIASARRKEFNRFQPKRVLIDGYNDQLQQIDTRISEFLENGSNWALSEIQFIDLSITSLQGKFFSFSLKILKYVKNLK